MLPPPWTLHFAFVFLFHKRRSSLSSQLASRPDRVSLSRIENSNNFCQTGRLKTHRSCFFKLSGPICESHACRAHPSVQRSQLLGKPQFYCIRTHTGASAHLADMRQKLMRKGVASLLVAPSQPFNAPKRWGSGLEHHPGAPAAFQTVLGMSRMRPGSGWKRPTSIPEPPLSVPGTSEGGPRSLRNIPKDFRIDFAAVRLRFGGVRQNPAASATPFASLFLSPLRACSATRTAIPVQSLGCCPACGLQFHFLFDVPLFLN